MGLQIRLVAYYIDLGRNTFRIHRLHPTITFYNFDTSLPDFSVDLDCFSEYMNNYPELRNMLLKKLLKDLSVDFCYFGRNPLTVFY